MVRKVSWENLQPTGCGGKREGVKGDCRALVWWGSGWRSPGMGTREGVQVSTASLGGDSASLRRALLAWHWVISHWLGLLDRWPVKLILLKLVFPFLIFVQGEGFGCRMRKRIKPCSETWHHQLQSCQFRKQVIDTQPRGNFQKLLLSCAETKPHFTIRLAWRACFPTSGEGNLSASLWGWSLTWWSS